MKINYTLRRFYFLVLILIYFSSNSLLAQSSLKQGDKIELLTKDGYQYVGTVKDFTSEIISIETNTHGKITLQRSEVSKVSLVGLKPSNTETDYYNSTNYFVNPSGYTLKKGQSFYQNVYGFFNSYTHGFSDQFQLSIGAEFVSFIDNGIGMPGLFFSPRYSIPMDNNKGSWTVGGTSLLLLGDDQLVVGVVQGGVTFGSRGSNFTISTGFGFTSEDGFSNLGSTIPANVSGVHRLSKSLSLFTDNLLFFVDGEVFGIYSVGLRFHIGRGALNLGIWGGANVIPVLPIGSFTIPIK
jgi:preprotein translocase subunit YajC